MSENIARSVELEQTAEEDLADDVIFEPSLVYEDRKVGIAVKDGIQVCWCCFDPVTAREGLDALMGSGIVVRICRGNFECRKRVGEANRKREEQQSKGNIIQLADLTEEEKVELAEEILEKKRRYRGS